MYDRDVKPSFGLGFDGQSLDDLVRNLSKSRSGFKKNLGEKIGLSIDHSLKNKI